MKILQLTMFNLKIYRKLILGWVIAIFAVMFIYMILFPSVKDIATIKMEALPTELLQFVGMENLNDMSNFVVYFGTIYNLVLVAISIFAVTFSANCIYNEEKNKTIEFLYSVEISRTDIYLSKCFTAYIAVMLVVTSAVISSVFCGSINGGETFNLVDVLTISKTSSITPFVFLSVGLMISGITSKVSGATVGSMCVMGSYMLGYLSNLLGENFEWLKYFSPFEVFNPSNSLSLSNETILLLSSYALLMVVLIIIGSYFYKNRDFNI